MFEFLPGDAYGPLGRSYRHYWLLLKKCGVVLLSLLLLAVVVGVPHCQLSTYRYTGSDSRGAMVSSRRKVSAWYLSVTGWKEIRSGQYGQDGCPFVMFVPLGECLWQRTL